MITAAHDGPQWPPKSPYEALLCSPTGRQRARNHPTRASPSPSPSKKSRTPLNSKSLEHRVVDDAENNEDEEDEETLQLRLDALEAKLKLRKLQAKKAKQTPGVPHRECEHQNQSSSTRTGIPVLSSQQDEQQTKKGLTSSKYSNELQVPLSPERRNTFKAEPRSPGRVLLGIDKGLRGHNVSLRRAPSLKAQALASDDPFGSNLLAPASASRQSSQSSAAFQEAGRSLQKSFSQRIAETRQQDKALKEHKRSLDRLRKKRSSGFGIEQVELEALKATSDIKHDIDRGPNHAKQVEKEFSRDQVMKAYGKATGGSSRSSDSNSAVTVRRISPPLDKPSRRCLQEPVEHPKPSGAHRDGTGEHSARNVSSTSSDQSHIAGRSEDSELHESFSSMDLSRRILPHSFLARTFADKTTVLIPHLLRDIKSPDFSLPPTLEASDFVVLGVIASKSSPLSHKDAHVTRTDSSASSLAQAAESEANVKGKYMVFTLTDLHWTLDLYLFTSAYTRFWKLTPGTVIAVLNPSIMPPPRGKEDTGRWSLVLNSSEDTVLEIGTAKDLGFCKAAKKDGKACDSWVDLRKTEFCEWHVDRGVEKCRRGRMEVQGMSAPFAPGGKKGGRSGFFGGARSRRGKEDEGHGLLKEGKQYDRESRSAYFIAPTFAGGSAAALLDADRNGFGKGLNKEEALRKRLAEREKEKDIARKLGDIGNGTGAEYLRLRDPHRQVDGAGEQGDHGSVVDAGALGLLGNNARNVQLSPVKRKRRGDGVAAARKKTRFVTAKGIREAGRESLGAAAAVGDEDCAADRGWLSLDGDLDIV
ncbi:hypothetical protein MMC13_002431 [Lambiella insularis]|nr:hypothetical protein [Lambiella insularis]